MNQQYPYAPFPFQQPYASVANDGRNLMSPKASLTDEEVKTIRENDNQFDFRVNEIELLKARCNHTDMNGVNCLVQEPDGRQRCTRCGTVFRLVDDLTTEYVEKSAENMHDICNTIKVVWKTMPEVVARNFFQFIPLLSKLTEMVKLGMLSLENFEAALYGAAQPQMYSPNFSAYQAQQQLLRNTWQYPDPYAQQAMQAQQQPMYQQPAYPQQGYMAPGYNPQMVNPMAVGTPNMAPAYAPPAVPDPSGFVQQPPAGYPQQQMQPQAAPAAAPAPAVNIPPQTQTVGDATVQTTKVYEN